MRITIDLTDEQWRHVQASLAHTADECEGTHFGDDCRTAWVRIDLARMSA